MKSTFRWGMKRRINLFVLFRKAQVDPTSASVSKTNVEYRISITSPTPWVSSGSDRHFRSQDCWIPSGSDQRFRLRLSQDCWVSIVSTITLSPPPLRQLPLLLSTESIPFVVARRYGLAFCFSQSWLIALLLEGDASIEFCWKGSCRGFFEYAVMINRSCQRLLSLLLMVKYAITIGDSTLIACRRSRAFWLSIAWTEDVKGLGRWVWCNAGRE